VGLMLVRMRGFQHIHFIVIKRKCVCLCVCVCVFVFNGGFLLAHSLPRAASRANRDTPTLGATLSMVGSQPR
jgi:hypothetical protein